MGSCASIAGCSSYAGCFEVDGVVERGIHPMELYNMMQDSWSSFILLDCRPPRGRHRSSIDLAVQAMDSARTPQQSARLILERTMVNEARCPSVVIYFGVRTAVTPSAKRMLHTLQSLMLELGNGQQPAPAPRFFYLVGGYSKFVEQYPWLCTDWPGHVPGRIFPFTIDDQVFVGGRSVISDPVIQRAFERPVVVSVLEESEPVQYENPASISISLDARGQLWILLPAMFERLCTALDLELTSAGERWIHTALQCWKGATDYLESHSFAPENATYNDQGVGEGEETKCELAVHSSRPTSTGRQLTMSQWIKADLLREQAVALLKFTSPSKNETKLISRVEEMLLDDDYTPENRLLPVTSSRWLARRAKVISPRGSEPRILFHCDRGQHSSATLACAWIMLRYDVSLHQALHTIRCCRPRACPPLDLLEQLLVFEQAKFQMKPQSMQLLP